MAIATYYEDVARADELFYQANLNQGVIRNAAAHAVKRLNKYFTVKPMLFPKIDGDAFEFTIDSQGNHKTYNPYSGLGNDLGYVQPDIPEYLPKPTTIQKPSVPISKRSTPVSRSVPDVKAFQELDLALDKFKQARKQGKQIYGPSIVLKDPKPFGTLPNKIIKKKKKNNNGTQKKSKKPKKNSNGPRNDNVKRSSINRK